MEITKSEWTKGSNVCLVKMGVVATSNETLIAFMDELSEIAAQFDGVRIMEIDDEGAQS